jgi:hypothetical protein
MSVNYHDMWQYIANKLSSNQNGGGGSGENIFSANADNSKQVHMKNEAAEIKTMSKELQEIIDDPDAPEDEKAQAINTLKML